MYVLAADRVGTERGQPFVGRSLIVGPTGFPLAGPASADQEEILIDTLDLGKAATARRLNTFNHLIENRRPIHYRALSVSGSTGQAAEYGPRTTLFNRFDRWNQQAFGRGCWRRLWPARIH